MDSISNSKQITVFSGQAIGGIDPGKSGGVAFIESETQYSSSKMPATERDIADLILSMKTAGVAKVFIEKVHSMPGQGVKSMFTFGQNYGLLRGILIAHQISFDEVTPRVWQKALGISSKAKTETSSQFKNRLKGKAQQLFPALKITLSNCDAILIAEYGRRFEAGLINK